MPARPTNFLIVHGTLGNPAGNWFPWLKRNLEADGHRVIVPLFPTPDRQSFAVWQEIAGDFLRNLDPAGTILVGHSMGAATALRFAETAGASYKAVFCVCPFIRELGLDPYDRLNATFVQHAFDWPRIKNNAARIFCLAGDNDPYVPLHCSKEVADLADAEWVVVEKGGHLNAESGYLEFPLLLDKIRQTVET